MNEYANEQSREMARMLKWPGTKNELTEKLEMLHDEMVLKKSEAIKTGNPVAITAFNNFEAGEHLTIEDVVDMTELNDIDFLVVNAMTVGFDLQDEDGVNMEGSPHEPPNNGPKTPGVLKNHGRNRGQLSGKIDIDRQ